MESCGEQEAQPRPKTKKGCSSPADTDTWVEPLFKTNFIKISNCNGIGNLEFFSPNLEAQSCCGWALLNLELGFSWKDNFTKSLSIDRAETFDEKNLFTSTLTNVDWSRET